MINEALIKIIVNTDDDSVAMEVLNAPTFNEETLREYAENHPAAALAHGIIMKINQELKATAVNMEKENENV